MNKNIDKELKELFNEDINPFDFDKERNTEKIAADIGKFIAEELINAGIFDRT